MWCKICNCVTLFEKVSFNPPTLRCGKCKKEKEERRKDKVRDVFGGKGRGF